MKEQKLLFLEWVHSCNTGEISQNERMTQWEGNYKAYLFLRANLVPLWQYLFHKFLHLGGKTKCQHLSSETFILCKSRFDYTFLFELMRLWLEWVRWSLNKFRKIDFFVLAPVQSVYDHISVESRITFRRRSLFSTRRPSDQFASIHPMLSASVPCNTTSFCYLGWQSVLRWVKNLNILMIITFFLKILQLFLCHHLTSIFKFRIITNLGSPSLELEKDSLRLCLCWKSYHQECWSEDFFR